jgi:hypothetical protein
MITPEWLAGFFDGEGCLTILRSKRYAHYTPQAIITNTSLETLQAIQSFCGGTIHARGNPKCWNEAYSLVYSGTPETKRFLEIIRPFLILKKAEVEFFLSSWTDEINGRQNRRVSKDVIEARERIKQELSAMKPRNNIPQITN